METHNEIGQEEEENWENDGKWTANTFLTFYCCNGIMPIPFLCYKSVGIVITRVKWSAKGFIYDEFKFKYSDEQFPTDPFTALELQNISWTK